MPVFLLGLLVAASAILSLTDTAARHRRLRDGPASYDDLADLTGVFDRADLGRMPGVVEKADGSFHVDPVRLNALPRTWPRRLLGSVLGECVSLAAAVAGVFVTWTGDLALAWVLVGAAAGYQVAGWAWAISLGLRHGREIDRD